MRHQYFIFTVSITKKAPAQRDFLGDGIVPSRELAGTEGFKVAFCPDGSDICVLVAIGDSSAYELRCA